MHRIKFSNASCGFLPPCCRYIQISKAQGPEGEAVTYHFAEQVGAAFAAATETR